MRIIEFVEFKEWFWEKFEEWRRGRLEGPTAFARYLGISQQHVSIWLNGKGKPGTKHITKLASKYPDVYQVLGLIPPDTQLSLEDLPPDDRLRLAEAMREINALDENDPDFLQRIETILQGRGFTIKSIK